VNRTTELAVTQVQPGVFVHIGALEDWAPTNGGDVANIGFVVGSRCVAVIDTGGTPGIGEALRAAVERTAPLPVCYVINTHAHPDHVLGNVAFAGASRPAPKFVASARFTHTLGAREPYYLNALRRDFGIRLNHAAIVYPTISVDRSLDLDLGDRVLTLQAWPTAHTDNDLTVYDRRTRTLFASDLLFAQHLPVLDGSLRGWISVMAELKQLDIATVVPGHGAVSDDWPAVMDAQADYLAGLLRDTRAAIRNRLTIRQAIDGIRAPPASHWLLTNRFHRRNVTAAYAELEWEDDDPKTPSGAVPRGKFSPLARGAVRAEALNR
jgi:quinoprotein relay system zinc metallohydrolase 2